MENKQLRQILLRQIIMAGKWTFYGVLLQVFFLNFLWADIGKAQVQTILSVKEYKLEDEFKFRNDQLVDIFNKLEKKTGYHFAYEAEKLNQVFSFTKEYQQKSVLSDILLDLSRETGLRFKQINKTIIVIKDEEKSNERLIEIIIDEITVTGRVTSAEDNGGLPGVNVLIKGTTTGTVTDVEGNYSIEVPDAETVLVFSSIGFISEEVVVGSQTNISISLLPDITSLEEIVVVGYGTQKKANVTGAVSSVDFEDEAFNSRALTNVSTMLTGMSSGIRVQQGNGLPSDNNEASINIRGMGSLNSSSSPLVLVDGQVASINSVSPNDVASVSILKDAASAAIYGSRASNGVILITTKTGKNVEGVVFNYNNYVGKKSPTILHDLVNNTPDYMTLVNIMQANSGVVEPYPQDYIEEWRAGAATDPIYYPNTNWWDAVIKDNTVMSHNISAQGGNEKTDFYTSIDYYKDDGLVPNTSFRRINFRNNLSYQVNDWLKLGNNFTVITSKNDPAGIVNVFQWFRATTPAVVPKHPDGRYGSGQLLQGEGGVNNPLLRAEQRRGEVTTNQMQGKVYAVLTPIEGLSITGSYFADLTQRDSWGGSVPYDQWNFQTNQVGLDNTSGATLGLGNSYQKTLRQVYDLYGDYTKSLGDHNINVLVGYNQEAWINSGFSASRIDLLSYDTPVLNAAASEPQNNGTASNYTIKSVFGRFSYNFKGKYLFETNLRYDGSSRFAPEERWGLFPSFSAGWVISEEEFWAPLNNAVNTFKVRASWGQLGNNGIGNYEWQDFYQPANYSFNEAVVQGLAYNSFGNAGITWETTNVLNIGADLRLFNTLTFDINYYNKFTNNILSNLPIPLVNGGIGAPRVNSAEVRNTGFETEIRYFKNISKLGLTIGANFGFNKNEIERYKGDVIEPRGSAAAWTEGEPIGIFWVREVDHIVQDQSEIDALIADGYTFHPEAPGPGDFLYRDANGDKAINDDDRVLKGNPIPLFTYGGNLGLTYAGFDFNVFVDGVGGWDRYLNSSIYALNHLVGYQWPIEYMDMWTEENPSTTIPKVYSNNSKNAQDSDFFLHSAAYLRIRSMQLGYTLPADLTQAIRLQKLRVFANLENYFTFTNWPTMDPEAVPAYDDQTYPLTKTFSVGLSVSF